MTTKMIDGVEYRREEIAGKGMCLIPVPVEDLWQELKKISFNFASSAYRNFNFHRSTYPMTIVTSFDGEQSIFMFLPAEHTIGYETLYSMMWCKNWDELIKAAKHEGIKISRRV